MSDKTGLESLARALHAAGVVLVSTGSTAQHIAAAGVPVTKVEEVTGFPECLDGRVKTLHPGIHAGLLADLTRPAHAAELGRLGIEPEPAPCIEDDRAVVIIICRPFLWHCWLVGVFVCFLLG